MRDARMRLDFGILGPLEVRGPEGPLPLGAGKQRVVLALLVLEAGRVVSAERLVDVLWGERPPARASTALQNTVSQLRKLLGSDAIATESGGYVLRIEPDQVDASRFERLVERARTEAPERAARTLREALGLWRGSALAELVDFPFAAQESGRLEELRLDAVEHRIAADLELGRAGELVGELEALVAAYPLREAPRGQLMLALYRSGRQAEALDAYQAARRTLVDELGIEPGPELHELQRRILEHDPALAGPDVAPVRARPALPEPATPLLGREEELETLAALLRDPAVRLVTLSGPGGAGKTRLALEAARLLADDFADGVALVELAALRDPALVVPAIAQALDVAEAPGEPLAATLRSALADRALLLVLDNLEQLVAAAPELSVLLAGCPGVTMLATSRAPLRIGAERELPLPPLDPDSAFALFLARATAAGATLDAQRDGDAVRDLCDRLDRLPLAIELAAARAKLLPPRALRERLGERLELLRGGARDLPARQQTLRAAIDWSHDLLEPEEQQLFARLAVFAGGFSLEAAEEVCGAELEVLASLVDKSMVRSIPLRGEGEARFELLQTIRDYALERLEASGEEEDLQRRHAQAYAHLVEQLDSELDGAGQAAAFARLDREQDNLRAGLAWAVEQREGEFALRLAAAMGWFWFVRGRFTEGRGNIEAALALEGGSDAVRAQALLRVAALAEGQNDFEATRAWLEECLAIRRALGDRPGVGRVLNNLGTSFMHDGNFPRARELLEEGRALAAELHDEAGVASTVCNLGLLALGEGDPAEALRCFEAAGEVAVRLGHDWGAAICASNAGAALADLGELERAASTILRGMHLFLQLGEPTGGIGALEESANLAGLLGDAEAGARLLGAAIARRIELGAPLQWLDRGRFDRTEAHLREQLGAAFEELRDEGERLDLSAAVALALAALEPAAVTDR